VRVTAYEEHCGLFDRYAGSMVGLTNTRCLTKLVKDAATVAAWVPADKPINTSTNAP
jgi:hypothetical protein